MAADGVRYSLQLPCVFSSKSRQYLAVCAQDGRLRVWNTDSKTLHQEFVPSAHLSATCTCIAWGPCRTVKRKKRKSEVAQVEERADLLAMGTAAGTVLIYSTVKGALHCTLWKADRAAVTSLCVSPDGKLLLSAGHVIKMWDLETKEVYRMSDTKDSPMPIPLLAAALGADPRSVLLAYGSHLQPVMEKVISIAERLGEMDLEAVSNQKGAPKVEASLQTDNFAVLLMQGLESKDANILNVRSCYLTGSMFVSSYRACLMVRWLKAVLIHHTSYLASVRLIQRPCLSHCLYSTHIKHSSLNSMASLKCFRPLSSHAAAGPGHPAGSPLSHDREQSEDVPQTDKAAREAASPNDPGRWCPYPL
ncbi:hypothetical protein GOODEAATRI_002542 [Goodea atripinnis]|uniref:Uncharacterized protein n=1 Tax=Goodea atripinnis TaxID=208336 RepID=A0ABV0N7A1_9TELE